MSRLLLSAALGTLSLLAACDKPPLSHPFSANPSADLADPAGPFAKITPEQRATLTHYVSLSDEDRNCGHDGGAPALQNRPAQLVMDDARKTKACLDKLAAEKEAARLEAEREAQRKKELEEKRVAAEQRKKAAAASLKSLKTSRDKMEGITWYKHPLNVAYAPRQVSLYFGEFERGYGPLRLQISYTANRWLFINEVWGRADGERVTLATNIPLDSMQRAVSGGTIAEVLDVVITSDQLETIKKLAHAKDATVRFSGKEGYVDQTLSAGSKKALREMIAAHEGVKDVRF